ncbi:TolC family protein [Bacteroides salyersiae]|nr:TolC family protein [Bacteroides salyersiae]
MRRPDIRSAEHQINAQAASLGASKSDWLPQVFIKGSVGYASKDFKDLTKHKSLHLRNCPGTKLDHLQWR